MLLLVLLADEEIAGAHAPAEISAAASVMDESFATVDRTAR